MNTSALEVFRSDCSLAGHHQMVAKFQQEIFRGRFSSRVFPVLTSTAESLLRHFLEWALETLKHESRFIGPVGSFQNGRIGTQQLQKRMETDGVTVNLVKSRCSGKDSWNHFLKRVLDMSFSKATDVFLSWVFLYLFGQVIFYQISVITQEQDFVWRFTITAAEFQSHSRTSLPKSSPGCFVNHISSSCGDCMTLRYQGLGSKACALRRVIDHGIIYNKLHDKKQSNMGWNMLSAMTCMHCLFASFCHAVMSDSWWYWTCLKWWNIPTSSKYWIALETNGEWKHSIFTYTYI